MKGRCPRCSRTYEIGDDFVAMGGRAKCPHCIIDLQFDRQQAGGAPRSWNEPTKLDPRRRALVERARENAEELDAVCETCGRRYKIQKTWLDSGGEAKCLHCGLDLRLLQPASAPVPQREAQPSAYSAEIEWEEHTDGSYEEDAGLDEAGEPETDSEDELSPDEQWSFDEEAAEQTAAPEDQRIDSGEQQQDEEQSVAWGATATIDLPELEQLRAGMLKPESAAVADSEWETPSEEPEGDEDAGWLVGGSDDALEGMGERQQTELMPGLDEQARQQEQAQVPAGELDREEKAQEGGEDSEPWQESAEGGLEAFGESDHFDGELSDEPTMLDHSGIPSLAGAGVEEQAAGDEQGADSEHAGLVVDEQRQEPQENRDDGDFVRSGGEEPDYSAGADTAGGEQEPGSGEDSADSVPDGGDETFGPYGEGLQGGDEAGHPEAGEADELAALGADIEASLESEEQPWPGDEEEKPQQQEQVQAGEQEDVTEEPPDESIENWPEDGLESHGVADSEAWQHVEPAVDGGEGEAEFGETPDTTDTARAAEDRLTDQDWSSAAAKWAESGFSPDAIPDFMKGDGGRQTTAEEVGDTDQARAAEEQASEQAPWSASEPAYDLPEEQADEPAEQALEVSDVDILAEAEAEQVSAEPKEEKKAERVDRTEPVRRAVAAPSGEKRRTALASLLGRFANPWIAGGAGLGVLMLVVVVWMLLAGGGEDIEGAVFPVSLTSAKVVESAAPPSYRARIEAVEHYAMGNRLAYEGKFEDAILEYKQAAALDPGFPHPHRALGAMYAALGKKELSAAAYANYLRLAPDAPDARQVKAIIAAVEK